MTNKYFYQGVLALLQEDLSKAETIFQEILNMDPSHADARTNLGVIALKQNKPQIAIMHFSEALGFDPSHENARNNLAATFIHHNRFENARTHYQILIENHPHQLEYHYNLGVAEMALGHLREAQTHFKMVLKQDKNHGASLTNLASIASQQNQTLDAIHYLKRAKVANPLDTSSAFMLDALTQNAPMREASLDYARNLFDNYALHYEKHMTETLAYTLPQHITKYLHQHLTTQSPNTLDLGCGTGLTGIILREISAQLTGVDLSVKMLDEAHQKEIYDILMHMDAIQFLTQANTAFYTLITAADVLPYFGTLNPLFSQIQRVLTPSGLFIFSTEISHQSNWQLQKTARFAHHPDYIQTLAQTYHFKIIHQEICSARKQANQPLPMMLYVVKFM